ncbi:MAG: sterol desaturase family protein [Pseudomonadota bacterium]
MEALLAWKSVFVIVFFAAFLVAERLRPAVQAPTGTGRLTRNGVLWGANLILSPLFVLPLTLLATQYGPAWRPEWLGGGLGLALDLILLDFGIYFLHRAFHETPFLWRFHEPHHLDETLDATTAVRFHFGEVAISAVIRTVFVLALDIDWTSVIIFEILVLTAAIFHHSNVKLPAKAEGVLSRFIVTPSIHWVHHHAVRADTDSNYALIFSLWDPLFGTRSKTVRTADMPIGVEGQRDLPVVQLLLAPFWAREDGEPSQAQGVECDAEKSPPPLTGERDRV